MSGRVEGAAQESEKDRSRDRAAPPRRSPLEKLRDQRLGARLTELQKDVEFVAAKTPGEERWRSCAESSLQAAEQARALQDLQGAWASCHQAQRFLYQGLGDEQLADRARILRREAQEKLKSWRKEAVLDLIGREPEHPKKSSAGSVVAAQFLLDEHFENVYFRLEALAKRARGMWIALGALAAGVLLLSCLPFAPYPPDSFLSQPREVVAVLLMGAAGAVVSGTLSSLGLTGRIPTVLQGSTEYTVRPLLGALSAIIVLAVLQSGLIPIDPPQGSAIYGWAVGAGFSDQLLNRVMGRLEQSAEQ